MEAQACGAGPVAIVGGGNSAGQAALFLSRSSAQVHVIIRGETLDTSMSRYLIDQIDRNPRITVTPRTQVTALIGKDQLEGVHLLDTSRQQTSAMAGVSECHSRGVQVTDLAALLSLLSVLLRRTRPQTISGSRECA